MSRVVLRACSVLVLLVMMAPAIAQDYDPAGPIVGPVVEPKFSGPARDLPPAQKPSGDEVNPPRDSGKPPSFRGPKGISDPVAQFEPGEEILALDILGGPILNYDGMGGSNPNDTNGDIGPNHFVQMINSAFAIWDRQGNLLMENHGERFRFGTALRQRIAAGHLGRKTGQGWHTYDK